MSQPFACILSNRGVLSVGGEDRRAFLQGLVSNDVNTVAAGKPVYAAYLTPQGKFLHDIFIVETGKNFLLDCEAARADEFLQNLKAHTLRTKVTLENVSGDYNVWAGWFGDAPKDWTADPRLPALGWRAIIKKGARLDNVRAATFADYDRHRLSLNVPDGSRDMIVGKSTLLECNLDRLNGISWIKGCYMGQELTARMHHRGLVKKRLFPVRISGVAPEIGTIVFDGAEDIGDMRSSSGDIGLALLDIGKAIAGKPFTCGTAQLLVLASPPPSA